VVAVQIQFRQIWLDLAQNASPGLGPRGHTESRRDG
jgi:hypothetical protein